MSRARSGTNFHTGYGGTKTTIKKKKKKINCLDCLVVSYWGSFHVIILISFHTHTPNAPNHLCLGSSVCCAPCVPLLCVKRASAGSYGTAPAQVHTRTHTERWPSLLHSSLRVSQLNGSSWFKAQNYQRLKVLVWELQTHHSHADSPSRQLLGAELICKEAGLKWCLWHRLWE